MLPHLLQALHTSLTPPWQQTFQIVRVFLHWYTVILMSGFFILLITSITALILFGIYKILTSLVDAINTSFHSKRPRETTLGDRIQETMVREQVQREVEDERNRYLRLPGAPAAAGGRTLSPPVYSGYSPTTSNPGIPFRVARRVG
ncbi:hypothetical protein HYALB_00000335 [Hymenoscyphus albidus]|uniref:Uncharacterized protein n=1 Tax=Hymenoscyphus albidus TaxID=595503 RepID=A0A9N9PY80_9HELO|nr:hypothetical protein HYALB_00000335 [Hymenoscyphus albidus]